MKASVIRQSEARSFLEGDEHCREYFKTGKITFGTSTLLPGKCGTVDKGHLDSQEVFFVSRGHVLLSLPDHEEFREMNEGDAIVVPEGVAHKLINVGEETAVITWSMAPSE